MPTRIVINEKCQEETFQFVNYLVCISNIKLMESREESFA